MFEQTEINTRPGVGTHIWRHIWFFYLSFADNNTEVSGHTSWPNASYTPQTGESTNLVFQSSVSTFETYYQCLEAPFQCQYCVVLHKLLILLTQTQLIQNIFSIFPGLLSLFSAIPCKQTMWMQHAHEIEFPLVYWQWGLGICMLTGCSNNIIAWGWPLVIYVHWVAFSSICFSSSATTVGQTHYTLTPRKGTSTNSLLDDPLRIHICWHDSSLIIPDLWFHVILSLIFIMIFQSVSNQAHKKVIQGYGHPSPAKK